MANYTDTWMEISCFTCNNLSSDHCTLESHVYSRARMIRYTEIDSNANVVVFIDLKKAFDTVDNSILFKKLSHHGIRDIDFEWFKSHLSGRKQCCKML